MEINIVNFIITGGAGLIGSNLLQRLIGSKHKLILSLDIRNDWENGDIRNISKRKIKEPVDILYHLAAFCKINETIQCPSQAFEHNVKGTYEVLQFCRKYKIPKIVFTSSTRVLYSERNPYTASKKYGEELIKSYSSTYGIDYSIIRPSTVYGPFHDRTNRLIHLWITAAFKDQELKIFGDKNKTLDFTYVDDFIDAFLKASEDTNVTYNVGSGREVLLKDVAAYIIDVVGKGRIAYYPPEKLQPQNVVIDTDFSCSTSIYDGLDKTIEFYRNLKND